jgi:hypothetical protein
VFVPRKLSESGKRETKYFASKSKSEEFIKGFKTERREHGKAVVSAEERHWIQVARTELGSLDALREVMDHWKKTGRGVRPISAKDSVESYIKFREARKLKLQAASERSIRPNSFTISWRTQCSATWKSVSLSRCPV